MLKLRARQFAKVKSDSAPDQNTSILLQLLHLMAAFATNVRQNEFWVMKPKWNSAFEFVHPDDLAKAESLLTEALLRPAVNIAAEFRLQHANGRVGILK